MRPTLHAGTVGGIVFAFLIASVAVFFLVSAVLARDEGRLGAAIRLCEILLPLAAVLILSGLFLKGLGHGYFPAACCFGLALAMALLRKAPSVWWRRPPEGARAFFYSAALVAGVWLSWQTLAR